MHLRDHQVEALARVGAVADDVAQAKHFVDALIGDVRQHGLQGFEVAVDVADDRALHRRVVSVGMLSWRRRDSRQASHAGIRPKSC